MKSFRKVKLVSSDELSELFISIGALDEAEFSDLNCLIERIEEFKLEALIKSNTFIQFINKPHGWDKF
jgi:hypothetical protein